MATVEEITGSDAPEGAPDYRKNGFYTFSAGGGPEIRIQANERGEAQATIEWVTSILECLGYDLVQFERKQW